MGLQRAGRHGLKITLQYLFATSCYTIRISIFLNLLKSTSLMLELGDRIEHCKFVAKFSLRCGNIVGMTIGKILTQLHFDQKSLVL